jgi:hypothetical protein
MPTWWASSVVFRGLSSLRASASSTPTLCPLPSSRVSSEVRNFHHRPLRYLQLTCDRCAVYEHWKWPNPVLLTPITEGSLGLGLKIWNPKV